MTPIKQLIERMEGAEVGQIRRRLGRDLPYLRSMVREGYTDFSTDPQARPACERLAAYGFCRVVQEDERAWRIYLSSAQTAETIALLKALEEKS